VERIFYLKQASELQKELQSHMKSSPFSGSTPAHFSCAHFENDVQRNRLSTLAEFRKLSWQKIHTASSSTFVFSLLFGSYSFTLS